jgi:hypothetical protein
VRHKRLSTTEIYAAVTLAHGEGGKMVKILDITTIEQAIRYMADSEKSLLVKIVVVSLMLLIF